MTRTYQITLFRIARSIVHKASKDPSSFARSQMLVFCFYLLLLVFAATQLPSWKFYLSKQALSPLWPIEWIGHIGITTGVHIIMSSLIIGTFLAALYPQHRIARIFCFFGILEFISLQNSFGYISHGSHLIVLLCFAFVFLPDGNEKQKKEASFRMEFLSVFLVSQALILLTYTMSGLWKLYFFILQISSGETNLLSPSALSTHIAYRLHIIGNSSTILGPWLIDHPYAGWPLFLGSFLLELFAFWAVFTPSFHRFIGASLILFHIGVFLSMGIPLFLSAIIPLGILFLFSPFSSVNNPVGLSTFFFKNKLKTLKEFLRG